MFRYTIVNQESFESVGITAADREIAIGDFSSQLGLPLTLDARNRAPDFLMDEWSGNDCHWTKPTIPVFKKLTDN